MSKFSQQSAENLRSCHPYLQAMAYEALKIMDYTVLCGYRPPQEQFKAFKKGRKFTDKGWIITNRKKIITKCDGYERIGKHNVFPSLAMDIIPYTKPLDWNDTENIRVLVGIFLGLALTKNITIRSGIDFNMNMNFNDDIFEDPYHIELVLKT